MLAGQTTMRDEDKGWATLIVETPGGPIDVSELVTRTRKLEEVAALLALDPDISGVQTFDAAQSETQRPRLCVFTSPRALAAVRERAESWLRAFELRAELRSELHDDEQWRDAWKRFYRPLVFGEHQLLLRPSWIDRSDGDPPLEIVLDPGSAFGTGLHQSTQLCLDQLCTLARRGHAPRLALDLGCGSGVLGLAALRLFPALPKLVAVDVDPEATAIAAENAELNQLADKMQIVTGTIASLRDRFDLVTANIRPEVLVPLATTLRDRVHPNTPVILSGILQEEEDRVRAAWLDAGWSPDPEPRRQRETWCALHFVS
jgi:ribosomal protein L11 methyltransferase